MDTDAAARIERGLDSLREHSGALRRDVDQLGMRIDEIAGALGGNSLHPDGIVSRVGRLELERLQMAERVANAEAALEEAREDIDGVVSDIDEIRRAAPSHSTLARLAAPKFSLTDPASWLAVVRSYGLGWAVALVMTGGLSLGVWRVAGCGDVIDVGGSFTVSTEAKPLPPQPMIDGLPPVDCETTECKIEALRRAAEAVEAIYDSAGVLDAR